MRKLIVWNIVSLDGFFSGPGGDVRVMPFDEGKQSQLRTTQIRGVRSTDTSC